MTCFTFFSMAALVYPTHPEMASARPRGAPPLQTMFCNLRSLALWSFSFTDSRKTTGLFPPECQNSIPERGGYRRPGGAA